MWTYLNFLVLSQLFVLVVHLVELLGGLMKREQSSSVLTQIPFQFVEQLLNKSESTSMHLCVHAQPNTWPADQFQFHW